ncbi:hypothetical protein SUGI_0481520 [Cryptomeria japonica]|nr:hypothetical protein SUGI_0481520 [Cryptomeria japonica]
MDFNLDPAWLLQLKYPSVQHHQYGAQIPMTAPPAAATASNIFSIHLCNTTSTYSSVQHHQYGAQIPMTAPPAAATDSNIFSHFPVGVSSQNRNGFQKTAHIDVGEDDVKIKNEEKPRTEISLANFSSEDPVKQAITCGVGTTINAIDNMGQIEKAQGYTPVNISTVFSLINIWNFLGRVAAGLFSEFLYEKYKFPRPLIFTIVLLIACLQHVFTAFPLPGSPYVASTVISLYFRTRWPKSFRSCLVNGLHFTNRKWRERANKGEGLKHLPCFEPREDCLCDINQYAPAVHSERTAATMDMVPRPRKLSEPSKPKLDRGSGAQHN